MSDGRRTADDGRRIRTVAAVVAAICCSAAVGAILMRSWMRRNRVIEGRGYRGVVFNQAHAATILGTMLSADPDGFWTPTDEDVRRLEGALAAAAQARHPEGLRALEGYRRPYFGYGLDGKRRILVIGFCDPKGLDWTRTFVSAGEGGCHFEATYDETQETITSLWALDGPGQSASAGAALAGR